MRPVDRLAHQFDLVFRDKCRGADDLTKLTHLIANEFRRFREVLGGGRKMTGHFGKMYGQLLTLKADRVDLFDQGLDPCLNAIDGGDDAANDERNGDQRDRHYDETD